jgi:hypothetical protein
VHLRRYAAAVSVVLLRTLDLWIAAQSESYLQILNENSVYTNGTGRIARPANLLNDLGGSA